MNRACTNVPTCYFGGTKQNNNSNNMDNFKLDLTQLTPVAEKDRVRGNWYLTSDSINDDYPCLRRWHSAKNSMDHNGCDSLCEWVFWFLIPPGLPGFPVAELPDEFELKEGNWEYSNRSGEFHVVPINSIFRRIKPELPTLTIPSGTRSEQLAKLKEILADFETF